MERAGYRDTDEFGNSVVPTSEVNVLQAVYNEHAKDGRRKHMTEVGDRPRRLLASENGKGQEARQGCGGGKEDGDVRMFAHQLFM